MTFSDKRFFPTPKALKSIDDFSEFSLIKWSWVSAS